MRKGLSRCSQKNQVDTCVVPAGLLTSLVSCSMHAFNASYHASYCVVHNATVISHVAATAQGKYGGKEQLLADVTLQSSRDEVKEDSLVEALVSNPLPSRQGSPLVEDWNCLRVSFCFVSPPAVLSGSTEDSVNTSEVVWANYYYQAQFMCQFGPSSF